MYGEEVNVFSLTELAEQMLDTARQSSSGRAATTVHGGREHRLRQTLAAMLSGEKMTEHSSPGEATLQMLSGKVVLHSSDEGRELVAGELLTIPDQPHTIEVLEDAVFLLSVALSKTHAPK